MALRCGSVGRIIPADAGSTMLGTGYQLPPTDHPRRCGEHGLVVSAIGFLQGSSPQMRGALDSGFSSRIAVGIIPADAGSTAQARPCWCKYEDHPRRCGEHLTDNLKGDVEQGSSPQMRGARAPSGPGARRAGIIPADAGSTILFLILQKDIEDHPRRCGEHAFFVAFRLLCRGSSPQMRGALIAVLALRQCERIIPADAGSTQDTLDATVGYKDHPRRCGEHRPLRASIHSAVGSSPQMRGALFDKLTGVQDGGIIPADAGSTYPASAGMSSRRDHPRRCGEHLPATGSEGDYWGSSPQMRGAHHETNLELRSARIIPADAGST